MGDKVIKLDNREEDMLDKIVKGGLFSSKEEAARAAILKYAIELGIITPTILWNDIVKYERRKVTPEQLAKDLKTNETNSLYRNECYQLSYCKTKP